MSRPKVKVIVTRRLPEPVETRMSELFDVEFNTTDRPMSVEQLAEAAGALRRAGADDRRTGSMAARWRGRAIVCA